MVKGVETGIDADQCPQEEQGFSEGLWTRPEGEVLATLILAHGAGAPMDSSFMLQIAQTLAANGVAVFRFEFPYMVKRRRDMSRRPPDRQPVLLACWRQVYAAVRQQVAGPLWVGGKSMGGRMASLVADELGADGLVCLGYPFHPPAKPETLRTGHLLALKTPTLIVQGERDPFGRKGEVEGYGLPNSIQLHWLSQADHDFKPLKSTGKTQGECIEEAAHAIVRWRMSEEGARGV